MNLENKLLGLLKGEYSSLTIDFNDGNAPNYMTVKEWCELHERSGEGHEWVSEAEKEKAYAENKMWTIQWYPNTPTGFYRLSASSLDVLLEALK